MTTNPTFGTWLKKKRRQFDLTQKELAQQAGCSVDTVRKIERDVRRPSKQLAALLADALAIPAEKVAAFTTFARTKPYTADMFDALAILDAVVQEDRESSPIPTVAPTSSAPLKSDLVRHNLPAHTTTFIGRTIELTELRQRLNRPDVRLLTLTGPGGTGKTRLSLQFAADMLSLYTDGVFFVDLAPLTDLTLVDFTIAKALGIRSVGDTPIVEQLKKHLRDKHILLVLDNFEHVLPAAPVIMELLAAAANLNVLVTSRSLLRLSGEWGYPVPPLELPDISGFLKLEEIRENEAVELFCERASAVRSGFIFSSDSAPIVAEICVALDGLPLAIELAAARIRLLPPGKILSQLSHRLKFLTGGPRDVPARQQTLRNTIDWSYDLLDIEDQILFQRLAVFVGGFTFEAVEAVGNISGEMHAFNQLQSLLDKNLLKQTEVEGEPRFDMLETIREYALERMAGSDQANKVKHAHAHYYLKMAEESESHMYGAEQLAWVRRLETEHDNLRSALQWSIETVEEIGLRLAGALGRFWHMHAHHSEGRGWLTKALATEEAHHIENRRYRAKALNQVGMLSYFLSDVIRACAAGEKSVSLWREVDDKGGLADALCDLGGAISRQGDGLRACALLEESIDLFHQINDEKSLVRAKYWYGVVLYEQGDYEKAALHLEETRLLGNKVGDIASIAAAIGMLSMIAEQQGDYERARSLLEESLSLFRQVEDKPGIALVLDGLGQAAFCLDDYEEARQYFEEGLLIWQELGNERDEGWVLSLLGNIALRQDDPQRAASLFEQSLLANVTSAEKLRVAFTIAGLAAVAQAQIKPERAARLLGISESLQESDNAGLEIIHSGNSQRIVAVLQLDFERTKLVVQELLEDEIFKIAFAQGQAMSLEQMLAYTRDANAATSDG